MPKIDAMGWMYNGGGLALYEEFYRDVLKMNVVPIPVLPSGPQAFGWFKRPIRSVADMKGMKCRQTGMAGEVWKSLGFTVVNMPGGEIIPSAQRGVIDCAEWVGGVEDLRLGFQNVWKYHYSPGVHENVTIGELLINGDGNPQCQRRASGSLVVSQGRITSYNVCYTKLLRISAA